MITTETITAVTLITTSKNIKNLHNSNSMTIKKLLEIPFLKCHTLSLLQYILYFVWASLGTV